MLPRPGGNPSNNLDERYAKKRVLGSGGMGEVVLAEDRDIGRHVALKYLTAPSGDTAALARFVDEIRVVGSLEHPNIVPIHDVGVDEANRYYFVMKYVEGETLESVIERLAAGDPAYHAQYTYTARVQLFIGSCARSRSRIRAASCTATSSRPTSWSAATARSCSWTGASPSRRQSPEPTHRRSRPADDESRPLRERALHHAPRAPSSARPRTCRPEQARGEVDVIDERSDTYCATALFHELVTLRHYLGDRESLMDLLRAIQNEEIRLSFVAFTHPTQGPAPAEFVHFVKKGLSKDPARRYQSARRWSTSSKPRSTGASGSSAHSPRKSG